MNPKKENIEDIIALTPVQEGLLFHYLRDRDSTRYFEQLCLEVSGKIDIDIFRKAWHFVVETNEMLRTVFRWDNLKKPVQIVLKEFQLNLKCVDYTTVYFDDKETLIKEIKNKDRNKTFDLREIPFRITLNKIKEDEVVILISNHHILYDGWSLGILLKEFLYAYDVFFHKKGITKPAKNRFSDYVKWIKNQDIDTLENYWQDYFKAPGNRYRAAVIERDNGQIKPGGHYRLKIDRILKNNLEGFVNKYKISLASVLHGAWSILLQNYNDNEAVIFDTTFSGRSAKVKGIETMVGLFINTLPFRVHVSPDKPVTTLLRESHHMLIESEEYQFTPLQMIDKYRVNHRQWFESVVVIENYPLDKLLLRENGEFKVRSYSIEETTRYDLTVLFTTFDELNVQFTYNKDLFDEGRISGLAGHLEQIIEEIVRHPGKTVKEIEITVDRSHWQKIRGKAKSRQVETNAAPPANEIEKKLAEIWSSVFGLEKHRISRCADFFQQGGHSLKAFNLISKISGTFNVNVPLVELFERPSIRDLAEYIEHVSGQKVQPVVSIPLQPAEKKEYYPLSPAQKRMYFQQQIEPTNVSYNVPIRVLLEGDPDKERLAGVFEQLIQRHESLRTSFEIVNNELVQRIHHWAVFQLEYFEVQETEAEEMFKVFVRPFDLNTVPLLRAALLKVADRKYILQLDMHHIISDFFSVQILAQDFMVLYQGDPLPELELQYKDFSEWQRHLFQSQKIKEQEKYWLDRFSGHIPGIDLPTDYPAPPVRSLDKGDLIVFHIEKELRDQLLKAVTVTKTTIFIYLLSVYYILLFKYTGQQDLTVGSTITGRNHPGLQEVFGMFVNMLAMRNHPDEGKSFETFLEEVKTNALGAYKNQDYPIDELIQEVGVQRNPGSRELFNTEFAMNNIDIQEIEIPGLSLKPLDEDARFAKFDLHFQLSEIHEKIKIVLRYSTELYKRSTVEKMRDHYLQVLEQVIENPGMKPGDIRIAHGLLQTTSRINEELNEEWEL